MADTLPHMLHTYHNHTLDSTRWDHFILRDDDIVISTAIRSVRFQDTQVRQPQSHHGCSATRKSRRSVLTQALAVHEVSSAGLVYT